MSHDEDEELEDDFKVGADEDEITEPLDIPEEMPDDDPEDRFH